ncbi:MAG: hypothetical protein ACI3YC_08795 [Alloprevotella sp.]
MKRTLSCLLRPFRWLRRFRNRCGYGIHSPFAFQFVTGVIYEAGEYYAYEALEKRYREGNGSAFRLKDCKLLFRLANFAHAETAFETLGAESAAREALHQGSLTTRFLSQPASADFICLGPDFPPERWREMLDLLQEGGLLVVSHVAFSRQRRRAWKRLLTHEKAQVTFDLADFGLIFFRPDLQREHRTINYY